MAERLPLACTQFQQKQTDFLAFAQNIHNSMAIAPAVTLFPTPPVLLPALQALITDYGNSLTLAAGRGLENVSEKNASRKRLQNALRTNAAYINQILQALVAAGTDYATIKADIASTGYHLSIDPLPAGPLPAPTIFRYKSVVKGQLDIHVLKVFGAKSYLIEYTIDASTDKQTAISSTSRIKIPGLPSASVVHASVCAIGANTSARNFSVVVDQVIV